MAIPTSRIERFVNLIGGEQNLPPKLPPPPASIEQNTNESDEVANDDNELSKLQMPTVDHFLAEERPPAQTETPSTARLLRKEPAAAHFPPQFIPPTVNTAEAEIDLTWDDHLSEPAPLGINFSPFGAVSKFCYKFVSKEFQQPLATAFFDAGKIFARDWDL